MGVRSELSSDGKTLILSVVGEFCFSQHREFTEAYASFIVEGGLVHVNLAEAHHMDSSGLGMLILLHDHTKKYHQKVQIDSPSAANRQVLHTASFDKLFRVT
jgi:anti-anti-sigma factor